MSERDSTALAIAHLIAALVEGGLTITTVLAQVRQTGVVPEEEWELLEKDFESGVDFWGDVVDDKS